MDTSTEFELFPYVGAGSLRFGMSPTQVERLLGAVDGHRLCPDGGREEDRGGILAVGYSSDNYKLDHIGFARDMVGVQYKGLKIFSEPYDMHHQHHVLRTLCADDGDPRLFLGAVVLFKFGFYLTGFQDEEEDDLAFALFPKGGKDRLLHNPKTKPFQF